MKRFWLGVVAASALAACSGGNPFFPTDPGDGGTTPPTTVPDEVKGHVDSITYDPVNQTLTIQGTNLDDTPYAAVYTRKPGLDVPGYEAYSAQDGSLGRHFTAYVKEMDNTRAAIVVSGGQFGHYFGGSNFSRTGAYDKPDVSQPGGTVSYAGAYVGLLNTAGDGGDLLPVAPGTPAEVRPSQAAEVTGSILIRADFVDNSVEGIVYNRVATDSATSMEDLELASTAIDANGQFAGEVEQDNGGSTAGSYAGIFGGTDASVVAGSVFAEDHQTGATGLEEYGVFVLAQCGTPNADPLCNQPHP